MVRELRFLQRAQPTTGTVTDLATSTSFQDQQYWTDYCPVVQFQTLTGETDEYDSNTCQNPPAYHIGQKVALYYDPLDPTNAQLHDFMDQYSDPAVASGLGAFLILIALLVYWIGFLQRKRAAAAQANWEAGAPTNHGSLADRELGELAEVERAESRAKKAVGGRRSSK